MNASATVTVKAIIILVSIARLARRQIDVLGAWIESTKRTRRMVMERVMSAGCSGTCLLA